MLLRSRPSVRLGVVVSIVAVALSTAAIYPLRELAPVVSLGVVYLLAVLLVSTFWGALLGVGTAVASAAAFNFFHIPPTGHFTIADSRNWAALGAFLLIALASSTVAELARARAEEARSRREEADLAADLARLLLAGELEAALPVVARRVAAAIGASSARIVLGPEERTTTGQTVLALCDKGRPMGALVLPRELDAGTLERIRERVVGPLETTLAAAVERERLLGEVVETAALRHSDVVKTALLRAVSHDLRTPLTAMVTAGEAVRDPDLSPALRDELGALIVEQGERLSRLVENLLDLSRLEAGTAEPRFASCSLEDVLRQAAEAQGEGSARIGVSLGADVPAVRADATQLERAFANLLENALRHGGAGPVRVRARLAGRRVLVRVVDQGPGIPPAEQARIFEPFYRAPAAAPRTGSGLGLAIAKGFIEANGGSIRVESVPGQGTALVVELAPIGAT